MTAVSKGYKNREGRADIFFLHVCVHTLCVYMYIHIYLSVVPQCASLHCELSESCSNTNNNKLPELEFQHSQVFSPCTR